MGRTPKYTKFKLNEEDYLKLESLFKDGWSYQIAMTFLGVPIHINHKDFRDDLRIQELRLKYCSVRSTVFIRNRMKRESCETN